ncbi:MAG TPA: cyclic nucleotide-binding domain-containing protein [Patescibacteria group bacterium]|nr:cyclic nucleotide-binding domain-containing protein [Patescibacteria group bacterium]
MNSEVNIQALQVFVRQYNLLNDSEVELFTQDWEEVSYKRKQFIIMAGQTAKHLYFVNDGIQRSYYIKDDKEYTMGFSYPPSFSGIIESFITQTPSSYYLETLSDSQLLRLSKDKLEELCKQYHSIEHFVRKAEEMFLVGIAKRLYEQTAFTSEEKFRSLLKRSPHLLTLIPHKYIASYIGVDPTNFSKFLKSIRI